MVPIGPGVALITGASRGIGRATALALARAGFDLVLWARTEVELRAAADEARELGVRVVTAVVNVADPVAVASAGACSLAGVASLRALVVNAGCGVWNHLEHVPDEQWRQVVGTNLDGAFHTLRTALPLLRANRDAQIVGIASDSSYFSYPGRAAYCASKAGFASLIETTRREVRSDGVRVTCIVPSRVDSFFRGKRPGTRPQALSIEDVAAVVAGVLRLPRLVEVREIKLAAMTSTFGPYDEVEDAFDD